MALSQQPITGRDGGKGRKEERREGEEEEGMESVCVWVGWGGGTGILSKKPQKSLCKGGIITR